jgi:hypothetical protein
MGQKICKIHMGSEYWKLYSGRQLQLKVPGKVGENLETHIVISVRFLRVCDSKIR